MTSLDRFTRAPPAGARPPVVWSSASTRSIPTACAAAIACALASSAPGAQEAAAPEARDGEFAWRCDRSPIAILNATIWSEDGSTLRREIVIENGAIAEVGIPGRMQAQTARVIDANGALVLPGLIDSHAHFVWPAPMPQGVASAAEAVATTARQTLASGVTTVRIHLSDLKNGTALRQTAADPCFPGPRVVLGGPALSGGDADPHGSVFRGVSDPEDARRKVREVAASGAEWLALHAADEFSAEELEAIVAEARAAGISLMGAGDRFEEARAAALAGVTTLEYLNRTNAPRYPQDLLDELRRRRDSLYLVPPIGYYTRYTAYRASPARVRDAIHTRLMRPALAAPLMDAAERLFREAATSSTDTSFETLGPKFQQLRAAGFRMLLGTDSGSPGQFHADAIWHEMRAWRDLGVPPFEIVRAGTALPAAMLGNGAIGAIRKGARADIVVYRGRLDAGEMDVRLVTHVLKDGTVFVRDGEWVGPPVSLTENAAQPF